VSNCVEKAKVVLLQNSNVLYGIFSVIKQTDCFPPREFLNDFLLGGNDPCDQDRRMSDWKPFELSSSEYFEIKQWWISQHPGALETALGAEDWDDWVREVLNVPSK
jgi:hypothetical protein